MADVRIKYDIVFGSLVILLIVCIIGLIYRKKWAYSLAVSANATLTLIPITVLLVSLAMTHQELGIINVIEINAVNLSIGLVSLCFWVWMVKSNVRNIFV
ncbi:MAG: hypothetical protein KZQ95_15295 [Candidatus Thiodiazotropha sp. (ex Epidulcina cf. delphinae)]|nr:hypothetical protein [Candidatus Thiodiazotropha sp. (ex Epidulcina cf. delphinae)]